MRHVIDKVILHLRQLLLSKYDINRKDECHQQHQRKYQRRNHETDRIENDGIVKALKHFELI